MNNKALNDFEYLKGHRLSFFTTLMLQRLFCGLASVLLSLLLVSLLYNSPITGALETETLRWRFELQNKLSGGLRSKDIVILYLGSWIPAGATEKQSINSLATILEKVETAHPTTVGIDLELGRMDSPILKDMMNAYSNVVWGLSSNSSIAASSASRNAFALSAARCGFTRLSVEENGMVTQLPVDSGLSDMQPCKETFCRVVASLYRASKHKPGLVQAIGPFHFINYANLEFAALDSADVLSNRFDPSLIRDKIVLIGNRDLVYTVPGDSPRLHKPDRVTEPFVQAFAIQTLIDESTIAPSSQLCFRLMLYALAVIGLLMPVWSHGVRFLVFAFALVSLFIGSYLALVWGHIFIQIWPFLIGLITSFIADTVAYAVTDLKERNRQLRQTQTILEKRNLELEAAQTKLKQRGKEIARARELGMEEERKRVALDLHDDALKELFLASTIVEKLVGKGIEPTVVAQVRDKLHEASEKIRRIMANLSPSALNVCGLPGAIENLADAVRKEADIEVTFQSNVGSELDSFDYNQAILIYRIVQEALNNVQKHANATKVFLNMTVQDSKLEIAIADNGVGMNGGSSARPSAYGLDNMRYRSDLIGAQLTWGKSPQFSTGTQITLQLNLSP